MAECSDPHHPSKDGSLTKDAGKPVVLECNYCGMDEKERCWLHLCLQVYWNRISHLLHYVSLYRART